jgi:5'-AMP-activated protein kinase, catalytic alpha subunit
VRHPNVI